MLCLKSVLVFLATVCSVLTAASAACAEEVNNRDSAILERASALVRQLGDKSFRVREQAARSLTQIGLPAVPALRQAMSDSDLEIRLRAGRLFEEVQQRDHERRLRLFLANADDLPDDILPGWKRYREWVGDDPVARDLFVDMQRAEPKLFRWLAKGGKQLEAAYEERCGEIQHAYAYGWPPKAALASVCALLFIGSDSRVKVSDEAAGMVYNFAHYNEFRSGLVNGPNVAQLKKLLGHWIAQPGGVAAAQKTVLAMRYNLREGLMPALEVVRGETAGTQLQYAMLAIGKLGGRQHIAHLEKLLGNQAVLNSSRSTSKITYRCEVRDVALAVIIHLSGQDPKQYGFKRLRKHSQYLFSLNTASFRNSAERNAAFNKWAHRPRL